MKIMDVEIKYVMIFQLIHVILLKLININVIVVNYIVNKQNNVQIYFMYLIVQNIKLIINNVIQIPIILIIVLIKIVNILLKINVLVIVCGHIINVNKNNVNI